MIMKKLLVVDRGSGNIRIEVSYGFDNGQPPGGAAHPPEVNPQALPPVPQGRLPLKFGQ